MADELAERIEAAFSRADEKLRVARKVLEAGFPAEAVPPAYYACFHVAEAALSLEGIAPRTHEGLKAAFGLHFIKIGRLGTELGSILRELKDERENGDYSLFPAITVADAERAVAMAERFVIALREFVQSVQLNGSLPGR
jgi:uncharacterized protein (UPF0332 family)